MGWEVLGLPAGIIFIIAAIICGADLIKAVAVWLQARKERKNQIIEEYQEQVNLLEEFKALHDKLDSMDSRLTSIESRLTNNENKLEDLTISDMNNIKAWIVSQYHHFMLQGWIDNFSADTLEKRYTDYKKEGGNSYIKTLMDRLRQLPMDPPEGRQ